MFQVVILSRNSLFRLLGCTAGQEGSPVYPAIHRPVEKSCNPELFIYSRTACARHFPCLLFQTRNGAKGCAQNPLGLSQTSHRSFAAHFHHLSFQTFRRDTDAKLGAPQNRSSWSAASRRAAGAKSSVAPLAFRISHFGSFAARGTNPQPACACVSHFACGTTHDDCAAAHALLSCFDADLPPKRVHVVSPGARKHHSKTYTSSVFCCRPATQRKVAH